MVNHIVTLCVKGAKQQLLHVRYHFRTLAPVAVYCPVFASRGGGAFFYAVLLLGAYIVKSLFVPGRIGKTVMWLV